MLVLGGRIIGPTLAETLMDAFLGATFIGRERYLSRFEKVEQMERHMQQEEGNA